MNFKITREPRFILVSFQFVCFWTCEVAKKICTKMDGGEFGVYFREIKLEQNLMSIACFRSLGDQLNIMKYEKIDVNGVRSVYFDEKS